MTLIDTHCHLNDKKAFPDPEQAVLEAQEAGVERMVVVGIDEEWSRYAIELADRFAGVYAAVGWHPNHAADYDPARLGVIEEMLRHPKAVALGEIGLDYHWDHATQDQQRACLMDQLDLAASAGKPIIFHCREAYPDLLDILEARPRLPYLFHCFAGDESDARRCMALDGWFGVDGPITYPKADALRSVVSGLPRERVLLETDAPWMSPAPNRGKRNQMAWLPYINAALASVWGVDAAESAALTSLNAERFFGLGARQALPGA